MLIWINGAFGAGKTQTAFELHRRLRSSHVADPELIGYAINKMLPPSTRTDFQDQPQWRAAVIATLVAADAAAEGPVIVPMTLVNRHYFDEIMSGLRSKEVDVHHFSLSVSTDTVRRRLLTRSVYPLGRVVGRDETWAIAQIDRCARALAADHFGEHVDANTRPITDVVEDIADRAGLTLEQPPLSALRYQARRLGVAIRHVRL